MVTSVPGSDGYERPFGANAPWNIPVDRLDVHPDSARLVDMLWNKAPSSRPGNFNLGFDSYTYPVYDAREATGWYTVKTTWNTNINGKTIPWNPSWAAAPGSDAQVIILDPTTGREWDLWQVTFDGTIVTATNGSLVQGDFMSYEGGNMPSRGIGIQYLAMLVRPEEIAQGRIEHALSLPARYTDKDTSVAPATKVEGSSQSVPDGIPIGTRFALSVTDAQIDQWVASLPSGLSPATLHAARIIAEALRDYGWFVTDTSGGAHFQFESNTTAASDWNALGLSNQTAGYSAYPQDLLDGLLRPERIYAVETSDQYAASAYAAKSATSRTLASGETNLALTGEANINGTGNAGDNDIRGNSGNNILSGLDGNDWLAGGLGSDTLIGGEGNDRLDGGLGSDIFVVARGGGNDTIRDFEAGAGAGDVVQLENYGFTSFTQIKSALTQSGSHVVLDLGGGERLTFQYRNIADFVADDFKFSGGTTSPPSPTPEPATLRGTEGPDQINGTASDETIYGLGGDDVVRGEGGNDTIDGGAGNDRVFGGAGDDRVDGGDGDDRVDGGLGNDWIRGGAGSDIFIFAPGYGQDSVNWLDRGYDKVDLAAFGHTTFDGLMKATKVESGVLASGASYVKLDFGSGDTLHIPGIGALTAEDVILASGTPGPSPSPEPSPTPAPSASVFELPTSGPSTNNITGTNGNDRLTGTSGNDSIGGRAGNDRMVGGQGDDIYYVDSSRDSVVEYSGQGVDTVHSWAGQYQLTPNVENLILQGDWKHSAWANDLDNLIVLSNGGDTVNAGAGRDILRAGTGADTMTGGASNDIFSLAANSATDVIADFRPGEDILDLRALVKASGYTGVNPYADDVIAFAANNGATQVLFDADGRGAGAPTTAAILSGIVPSALNPNQDVAWS